MASYRQSFPIKDAYDRSSSPDPLADSSSVDQSIPTPTPQRRSTGTLNAKVTQSSALRRTQSGEIEISPSKMIAEQSLSPWRIKVTVEAEPESGEDTEERNGRTQLITRTMKVLLKDGSSPTKATRRNSKSRKSASPARMTRSRRQSVTNLDIAPLGDDEEDDEWSAKPKSPRKRREITSKSSKASTLASRRSTSEVFEIRGNVGFDSNDQDEARTSVQDGSPELKDINLNQINIRARSNSLKQKGTEEGADRRKVSVNSAISYPTPSPTASEHGGSDDHADEEVGEPRIGLDTVMESEGFTMIDLDSLPSIKQIRKSPQYPLVSKEPESDEQDQSTTHDTTADMSRVTVDAPSIQLSTVAEESSELSSAPPSSPPDRTRRTKSKKYSIGHLQLPSSTNVQRHRLVTPMPVANPLSSPKLPSPPRAPVSVIKERSPASSEKAVEVTKVLQDALTPDHSLLSGQDEAEQTRSQDEQKLFGGFSSGTRRELRAELRFGEELGKRQVEKRQHEEPELKQNTREIQQIAPAPVHIWRGESTVQHTPPATFAAQEKPSKDLAPSARSDNQAGNAANKWTDCWQEHRDEDIRQTNNSNKNDITTTDDDAVDASFDEDNEVEDGEETMGDIWLAEARQTSSSPKEDSRRAAPVQHHLHEDKQEGPISRPRRSLIPSPWKRGQQIDANGTSCVTSDESFSGMFWQGAGAGAGAGLSAGRFGDAVVAHPERVTSSSRTETEEVHSGEGYGEEEDNDLEWRNVEDVVEEETMLLEAEHEYHVEHEEFAETHVTHLYETNLDDLLEQDLSRSPQVQVSRGKPQAKPLAQVEADHDSTYSSISNDSTVEIYRQRTSLSPSKNRPSTPRSALKGGRASFSMALNYGGGASSDEARKVVWAKKAACVNELWEESTRSIRSTQTQESSVMSDDTPTPRIDRATSTMKGEMLQDGLEASFEVDPQPPVEQHEPEQGKKGWFGWFSKDNNASEQQQLSVPVPQIQQQQEHTSAGLDGSLNESDGKHHDGNDTSFLPTSRHIPPTTTTTTTSSTPTPSYLLPPSYPSDHSRSPTNPLPTSGSFTNIHFRTLHIIYRKSLRPRFHGPIFPQECRPQIVELVRQKYTVRVDETERMGEELSFVVGRNEGRVLERFMREVEFGYTEKVEWGWTVEELAERLGRIAIGEVVRGEEKESRTILRMGKA